MGGCIGKSGATNKVAAVNEPPKPLQSPKDSSVKPQQSTPPKSESQATLPKETRVQAFEDVHADGQSSQQKSPSKQSFTAEKTPPQTPAQVPIINTPSQKSVLQPNVPVLEKLSGVKSPSDGSIDDSKGSSGQRSPGDKLSRSAILPPIVAKEKPQNESSPSSAKDTSVPSKSEGKGNAEDAIIHEFDDIDALAISKTALQNKLVGRVAAEDLIEDKILARGEVSASLAVVEQEVIRSHLSASASKDEMSLYHSNRSISPATSKRASLDLSGTYTKEQLIEQSVIDPNSHQQRVTISKSRSAQDFDTMSSGAGGSLYGSAEFEPSRRRTSRLTPDTSAMHNSFASGSAPASRRSSYVPIVASPLMSSSRPDMGSLLSRKREGDGEDEI